MIETTRHQPVFNSAYFNKAMHIIGCGATGSRIALELVRLGVKEIHLWDFDIVEAHNIPNQAFTQKHIGQKKCEAVAEMALEINPEVKVVKHDAKVEAGVKCELAGVVFLLVDSMQARKDIYDEFIDLNVNVDLVIETRMGADSGSIYSFNPIDSGDQWRGGLYDDDQAEVSFCGSLISVGPTACFITSMAVWQFIKWFNWSTGHSNEYYRSPPRFDMHFGINPEWTF